MISQVSQPRLKGFWFPRPIIAYAVWTYHRFALSWRDDIERRIENVIAQVESFAVRANLLRSIPGIGPVSAAMLIAESPELGRMTSGEAAAMTGLAPVPHDSGARQENDRGRTTIFTACAVPSCARRRQPQSRSQASRKASQRAREATQTRHYRNPTQAGHNRKRDH